MAVNIYDSANQIERDIRQLPEFLALEAAFGQVRADEAAFKLFKEFQSLQTVLQNKQMQGEEFSEEDAKQAQELAEAVQKSPLITDLMNKEQSFSLIINDLNQIIMKPIQELYSAE